MLYKGGDYLDLMIVLLAGFASWVLLVMSSIITCCAASHYGKIIKLEKIPPKNMINPYEKKGTLSQDNAFYFRENKASTG